MLSHGLPHTHKNTGKRVRSVDGSSGGG
jgi:hypothetical protein